MGRSRSPSGSRVRDDVAAALAREEVTAAFQPVVDLRTGLVAGYEALARFPRDATRGPADWFALAHEHGAGPALEARAAGCALGVARRPFGAYLAINCSPTALVSKDVQDVLPIRLDGVVIELTGQGEPPDAAAVRAACEDVRARGGRIALDLAGADHAGLRRLEWAGPDILKLERTLVSGVHADGAKAAFVQAMVHYARDLDLAVCAEGVEALDDLQRLAELDVTYAQGWAAGRPARPWSAVDADAARICRSSVTASVTGATRPDGGGADDRLQWLSWKLSEATDLDQLHEAVGAIVEELGADEIIISLIDGDDLVHVAGGDPAEAGQTHPIAAYPATARLLQEQDSAQVLTTDPHADPAELELLVHLGFRSLLMLPVCCAGRTIGLFEAYHRTGRPFSRYEIGRARMIALQLGASLERLTRPA